jgi:hypothetical protein
MAVRAAFPADAHGVLSRSELPLWPYLHGAMAGSNPGHRYVESGRPVKGPSPIGMDAPGLEPRFGDNGPPALRYGDEMFEDQRV